MKTTWYISPWFIATVLTLIYALSVVIVNNDSLALVTIGTRFSEGIPQDAGGTEGYDGQFVYFIARDPSTAEVFIANGGDYPAYRYQRILLPALARIFSLGNTDLIPWAILFINLLAIAGGTAALESLLKQRGISRWYALGYALSLAIMGSARLSLPEPLAYGLVLIAMLLIDKDRWLLAAGALAFAGLAKETTLIFAAGYGLYLVYQRRWRLMLIFSAITLIPFAVWQIILYDRFGTFGIGSGGAGATGFTVIPFGGVLEIVIFIIQAAMEVIQAGEANPVVVIFRALIGVLIFAVVLIPFVIYPTIWGLRHGWVALRTKSPSPLVFVLLINCAVMLFVPFSTYREVLGILRFIAGLEIVIILFAAQLNAKRMLRYTTFWALTIIFLIGSG
ncbi:MAG: hypothetical protein CUN56_13420 [Phototrophicales bacterium]|nr:MAG: hypothetical protein CUN56_13420 [Phototrophicales bacterium]